MKHQTTAIVGSGNLARALVERLKEEKWPIQWICSRNSESGNRLAKSCNAAFYTPNQVPGDASVSLLLLCVPDDQIASAAVRFRNQAETLVHWSGSVDISALGTEHAAVLWPVMTFSRNSNADWSHIPLLWEAASPKSAEAVFELAQALGGETTEVNSENRRRMHLAAVFANNFTNACIAAAQELARQAHCAPDLLDSLILQTFMNAITGPAQLQQTGPARRGDTGTMERHLAMLQNNAQMAEAYRALSAMIEFQSKKTGNQ